MALTSAQRKLQRGVEQVQTINGEARAFQDGYAYVLRPEPEVRSAEEVHYNCYAVERKPVPDYWPLLIGEALHNLRASLDHVVWSATKRPTTKTQFPIFTDPCEFQVGSRPMIARTEAAVRAIVEEAQPYKMIDRAKWWDARWDPLAVLRRFSNRDKHRELVTVASFIEFPGVGHDGAQIEFTYSGEGKPLHHDAKVVSFFVRGPQAMQMHVEPTFAYEVRLEGVPLISCLEGIAWRVEAVVRACESGQPLGLWLRPLGHGDPA